MLLFIDIYVILFIDIICIKFFNGLGENRNLKIVGNLMLSRGWGMGTGEWWSEKTSIISTVLFLKKTVTRYQYSKIINSEFGEDEFFFAHDSFLNSLFLKTIIF